MAEKKKNCFRATRHALKALYILLQVHGGYPITPSTEVAGMSVILVGGKFIQMEGEIVT